MAKVDPKAFKGERLGRGGRIRHQDLREVPPVSFLHEVMLLPLVDLLVTRQGQQEVPRIRQKQPEEQADNRTGRAGHQEVEHSIAVREDLLHKTRVLCE